MTRPDTCTWRLAVLMVIATVGLLAAGPAAAKTVDPNGTCDANGCDVILDNVPPAVSGTAACPAGTTSPGEWHFVINQLDQRNRDVMAPATITAAYQTAGGVIVFIDANKTVTDPEVGYTNPGNLADTLLQAFAEIQPGNDAGTVFVGADQWNGQFLLSHAPCGEEQAEEPTSEIVTEVHLADHTPIDNANPATTGAMVHDKGTLTFTTASGGPLPVNSSVTFHFFTNNNCTDPAAASEVHDVSGQGSPVVIDPALAQGPLADGGYSYKAVFTSGDPNEVPNADSGCEPFTVVSSITSFSYSVDRDGDGTAEDGPYGCTTLGGVTNTACATVAKATNTGGKNKVLSRTDYFLVHVDITNNSGETKDVKVQGGLAAQANYYQSVAPGHTLGAQITTFPTTIADVDCGNAQIDLSSANNVITWIIDNMAQGQTCNLFVWVQKGYTSPGLQAVTSSWSQVDCPEGTVSDDAITLANRSALGESQPGCVKSDYTGNLLVNVQ
jgi:hypothetical protein